MKKTIEEFAEENGVIFSTIEEWEDADDGETTFYDLDEED